MFSIAKYDNDIAPMAASTLPSCFWALAWTSKTLQARELRAAAKSEQQLAFAGHTYSHS
jgi:hypothetical protein